MIAQQWSQAFLLGNVVPCLAFAHFSKVLSLYIVVCKLTINLQTSPTILGCANRERFVLDPLNQYDCKKIKFKINVSETAKRFHKRIEGSINIDKLQKDIYKCKKKYNAKKTRQWVLKQYKQNVWENSTRQCPSKVKIWSHFKKKFKQRFYQFICNILSR